MPPNMANGRLHWRVKYRRQKEWQARALVFEKQLRGVHVPLEQVRVTAVLYPHQRMDDDNAIARLKWCLDLLVKCQVIVDDKRPHCELAGIPEQIIDRKNPRVELTVDLRV
jgi:hypothetical protein